LNQSLAFLASSSDLYPTNAKRRFGTTRVSVTTVDDRVLGSVSLDLKASGVIVGGRLRKMRRDLVSELNSDYVGPTCYRLLLLIVCGNNKILHLAELQVIFPTQTSQQSGPEILRLPTVEPGTGIPTVSVATRRPEPLK